MKDKVRSAMIDLQRADQTLYAAGMGAFHGGWQDNLDQRITERNEAYERWHTLITEQQQ